jgi:P4 family phage/plasmid primase-like protien
VSRREDNTAHGADQEDAPENSGATENNILSLLAPTKSGGLQGIVLDHKLTVFEREGEWKFNIELPNGETRWGRTTHGSKETAAKAAVSELNRMRRTTAEASERPSPGGAKRTRRRPGKSQKQLQDELSAKLKGGKSRRKLHIGSDVEIAKCVCEDLHRAFGEVAYTEGRLWVWAGTHWVDLPEHLLSRAVHPYDGVLVAAEKPFVIRLSKGKIASIVHEVLGLRAYPDFFVDAPTGINCASGFIEFDDNGEPTLRPHDRKYRQRHVLPGEWQPGTDGTPPIGSLLHTFLSGIFLGDPDERGKINLLQELLGSAATGMATRLMKPKAAVLHGPSAENGKSQFLDIARGVLPEDACASVTPAKMSQDYFAPALVGKLLNASDETSGADAIASETFKSVITGEPVNGRPIYGQPVTFRPRAQHLFATNVLPAFKGGMDKGVRRRLLVIPFNRTIPEAERIESIGQRIAWEEPDLLLAWTVEGASRLMRHRGFTEPQECKQALNDWLLSADAVEAWFEDVVIITTPEATIRTRDAYAAFKFWAQREGFKDTYIPAINSFTQKLRGRSEVGWRRGSDGAYFFGFKVRSEFLEEIERLEEARVEQEAAQHWRDEAAAARKVK